MNRYRAIGNILAIGAKRKRKIHPVEEQLERHREDLRTIHPLRQPAVALQCAEDIMDCKESLVDIGLYRVNDLETVATKFLGG